MEDFVALIAVIFSLTLPIAIVMLVTHHRRRMREIAHKERLAALEKGMDLPMDMEPAFHLHARNGLRSGITMIAIGLGLAWCLSRFTGEEGWVWGVFVAGIGVAKLIWWFVGGKAEYDEKRRMQRELHDAYVHRLRGGAPSPDGQVG